MNRTAAGCVSGGQQEPAAVAVSRTPAANEKRPAPSARARQGDRQTGKEGSGEFAHVDSFSERLKKKKAAWMARAVNCLPRGAGGQGHVVLPCRSPIPVSLLLHSVINLTDLIRLPCYRSKQQNFLG
jgi:hypothetical protein